MSLAPENIEIRPYRDGDDLAELTELIHAAYAPHACNGLHYWATHQSVKDTEKRLKSGIGLIMLLDGRFIGTITVRAAQPTSSVLLYREQGVHTLSQFCIAPAYKGRGLGKRLHARALDVARDAGAKTVALDTARPATSLIALYEAWGYRIVGECDWRPHTNYVSVVMAQDLR